MTKSPSTVKESNTFASSDDIKRIIGNLDETKLFDIMALRPTIVDVEQASIWLSGDADVFGAGQPLKGVAGEIVAILTADEEEEPPRA
jgi:hypothetical protein